jgi:low temperature requirement protein LtrA
MAAGIPRAFDDERDFAVMTVGYVIMRLGLVPQWLRVAVSYPDGRRTALRFALGITVLQIGWLLRLLLPDGWQLPAFVALAAAELALPVWGEAAGRTSWHARHTVERYGLFTIIVLGESVLSATLAVQVALDADSTFADVATIVVGGLLIVFSMWWIYFSLPSERVLVGARRAFDRHPMAAFMWSYGHYFVLGGAAAAGAGLAVAVDQATDHSAMSTLGSGLAVTVPVAIYLVAVWLLNYRAKAPGPMRSWATPLTVALVLASSLTPQPVLLTGVLLAALVAFGLVLGADQAAGEAGEPDGDGSDQNGASKPATRRSMRQLSGSRRMTNR